MQFRGIALTILIGFAAGPALADVAVTRQDCDRMVAYQQPPGVEYQPGVDAHGQTVVPADLNASSSRE